MTYEELRERVARMVVDCSATGAPILPADRNNADVIIRTVIETLAQDHEAWQQANIRRWKAIPEQDIPKWLRSYLPDPTT